MGNDFASLQAEFAGHMRSPADYPAPAGIEQRRLTIYRRLIYNNIEGFIAGGFPILRQLMEDEKWHRMVGLFVRSHKAESPYFLEISQEFLTWLREERAAEVDDPAFLVELAHYEWVELALDVASETIPATEPIENVLDQPLQLSPLAWSLSYQYPVHQIGPGFQPDSPPAVLTYLVVYRNRQDHVRFMEINAITARLLALLDEEILLTGRQVLHRLAEEIQHPSPDQLLDFGAELFETLASCHIII